MSFRFHRKRNALSGLRSYPQGCKQIHFQLRPPTLLAFVLVLVALLTNPACVVGQRIEDPQDSNEIDSNFQPRVDRDTQSGIDSDIQSGIDSDSQFGIDSDSQFGIDSDIQSGIDSDIQSGIDNDSQSGNDSDIQPGEEESGDGNGNDTDPAVIGSISGVGVFFLCWFYNGYIFQCVKHLCGVKNRVDATLQQEGDIEAPAASAVETKTPSSKAKEGDEEGGAGGGRENTAQQQQQPVPEETSHTLTNSTTTATTTTISASTPVVNTTSASTKEEEKVSENASSEPSVLPHTSASVGSNELRKSSELLSPVSSPAAAHHLPPLDHNHHPAAAGLHHHQFPSRSSQPLGKVQAPTPPPPPPHPQLNQQPRGEESQLNQPSSPSEIKSPSVTEIQPPPGSAENSPRMLRVLCGHCFDVMIVRKGSSETVTCPACSTLVKL